MTETEWRNYLLQMDDHERAICDWPPAEPDPAAKRCVESRHRTLAHLRACQEAWLEACVEFDVKPNPRLEMLHPWRLFDQKSYERIEWDEHMAVFVADRARWKHLLESADRLKSGKINGQDHSIETLTRRLVLHEHGHLFEPK